MGNVSHHARVLAAAGLLEEAPELARDRRERWWRLVRVGISWSEADFEQDPGAAAAASAATQLGLARQVELTRSWLGTVGPDPDWRGAAFSTDYWISLSADELAALADEVNAVLARWQTRPDADDSEQRRPVFVFARGFPATP